MSVNLEPIAKKRCLALTRQGNPCRNWAMQGSEERCGRPLCRAHTITALTPADGDIPWHLYAAYFSVEERAALKQVLDTLAGEESLSGEIEAARIMLRRLFAHMASLGELTTDQIVRLAPLVLFNTRTIARLLKDKQLLRQGEPDGSQAIFDKALDMISEEWGVEL